MKIYLIAILLVGFVLNISAQNKNETKFEKPDLPIDETTGKITYSEVINTSGSAQDLYDKALNWYNTYYNNPTDVIREKDPENKKIVGKARIKILHAPDKKGIQTMKGIVLYSIITEFKDNRFKYTVTDINLKAQSYFPCEKWLDSGSQTYSEVNNYYLQQVDEQVKKAIKDLKNHMTAPPEKKAEDW
ncbi:MAG: hypothetical protein Kow0068_10540 [Marinilabiliales bacterium]